MKKLLYITVCMFLSISASHKLEKVNYVSATSLEEQLELATLTLFFDSMPAVQKIVEDTTRTGFKHARYIFSNVTLNDTVRQSLQEFLQHKQTHYYITYAQTSDGLMLDLYYDPRHVMYVTNNADGINEEYTWVLRLYNAVLLDMHQYDDKPLIQFAYNVHDKYETSCFLI